MKKLLVILLALMLILSLVACKKADAPAPKAEAPAAEDVAPEPEPEPEPEPAPAAAVGSDAVEAEAAGAGEWDPVYTIALQVAGPEGNMLFDGTVALKSPTMWASEFLKAAMTDKGLAQTGIDDGYVTVLGDYAANPDEGLYWLYAVNGISPMVGCNQYQLREGDLMVWTYGAYTGDAEAPAAPTLNVGADAVEAEAAGAGEWDPVYTIGLQVVGPEGNMLFDGTVALKSPTMWASEFLKAAMTDKGLAQTGIDDGYVTVLGDYAANPDEGLYWLYTVNETSPMVGCNQYQLRDGDLMVWTYGAYTG